MPEVSHARIDTVLRATKRWQNELVDTSGRNRLRRYRDLKTSTLDLTPGRTEGLNARALNRVLADKAVSLGELFSEPANDPHASPPFEDARRRLNAIHRTALTNREEKGIETCFAGIGLATWKVEQGTEPNAPVILLPLEVHASGAAARDFKIEVSGDAHLNPVLTHILRDEHDIDSEGDEADVAEDPPMDLEGFHSLLARLGESWSNLPDLTIEPRIVVANFSYSTMPLVSDLSENGELFAESDIVAAIAGDASAREALTARICDPDPNQPDIDPPRDEFLVLDADSSQHMAINRVLGGESLVIQGPPGTGKSQTIVNLITALIARGKRVLFVAEKRAAIDAVTKRLDQVGLSDLVMDMHGRITSRRDFARTLADSLDHVATIPAHDYSRLHGRLEDRRNSLIANDAALHQPREPWNLCVFHMRERLLAIPEAARSRLRLSTEASRKLDKEGFERLAEDIEEWLDLGGHTLAEEYPEWSGSSIATTAEAREAFDLIRDLASEGLPGTREALFGAVGEVGLERPASVAGWQEAVDFLSRVEATLTRCHPEIYGLDHPALVKAISLSEGSSAAAIADNLFEQGPELEQEGFDLIARLGGEALPEVGELLFTALDGVELAHPATISEWENTADFLSAVAETLEKCRIELFELDLGDLCTSLSPVRGGALGRLTASLLSGRYRGARRRMRSVIHEADSLTDADLLDVAATARDQLAEWKTRRVGDNLPRPPSNLSQVREGISELLADLRELGKRGGVSDLQQHTHTELAEVLGLLTSHQRAKREMAPALRSPERLSAHAAVSLLEEAIEQTEDWKRGNGEGHPRVPSSLPKARERVAQLAENFEVFSKFVELQDPRGSAHGELGQTLERLAAHPSVVASLPRIREIERRFQETGVEGVIERARSSTPELTVRAVEHAWLRRVLDDLEFDDRRLSAFDSEGHSRHRDEFAEADRHHLESTPQRVHRLTAEAIISTMNFHREETALVKKEAAKKRRHLSVRQLFAQAPHVLTALRPCWTMSPVLAAEMIPLNRQLFDVVIFDEASQIPPAEAIGSLARASQAVVAGDSRQLPPTSFFGRDSVGDEDEEDADALALTEDMESLLDAAGVLLRDKMLQWHYRSRDDRLIAFSNGYIYGGSLTAFPGAIVDSPISHSLVPFRPVTGVTGTRSNPDEVEKVVDLVLEHARELPNETLGVIAFGQHHAGNIENALMRRLEQLNDSSLDEFFSETNEERFFVKNIERVQGDERDVIILSVGYHKDANGNMAYRFGPLNQEGGERRLNVAVTRARSRVTLVSSFSHRDMDPARSSARGAELLRQYLEYASSGGTELGAGVSDVPLNPFELSIKEGLERRGIPVTAQYGVSGYRIDFACAHPEQPGRMVLAVEADGASYHSSHTARDRDRLRQQVLEGKGWRFHRIWSTAWFRDREAELDKAEEAWRRAVAASDDDGSATTAAANPRRLSRALRPTSPQRGPSPGVPPRGSPGYNNIDDYSLGELVQVARWIESDTLLRTEDDLLREMMDELGFKRSGKRITDALQRAITRARS